MALNNMEDDLREAPRDTPCFALRADARRLPIASNSVDVVITSPPYPNRHDYTRVFAVELELAFGLGDGVKQLRYAALHSHPEARSTRQHWPRPIPSGAAEGIATIEELHPDPRIPKMLRGYFVDMALVLAELARVMKPGARGALVLGNVQYSGIPVNVDEHVAELAEEQGFTVDVQTLRARGNSAQQMATFGRRMSRESAVLLTNPQRVSSRRKRFRGPKQGKPRSSVQQSGD